jgi:hypothetical protein
MIPTYISPLFHHIMNHHVFNIVHQLELPFHPMIPIYFCRLSLHGCHGSGFDEGRGPAFQRDIQLPSQRLPVAGDHVEPVTLLDVAWLKRHRNQMKETLPHLDT